MTEYFEAPDGHGEPTLWAGNGDHLAVPVIRRSDVPKFWPDVVARMTGTTITNNDATIELIAATMYPQLMNLDEQGEQADWATADGPHRQEWIYAARAVLAALTGVPHDV